MESKLTANYKNLERIISWIENSDQKAATVLAVNGLMIGYIAGYLIPTTNIIKNTAFFIDGSLPIFVFTYIILSLYFFSLVSSFYKAIKVLFPDIKERIKSIFFFRSIANMKREEFIRLMKSLNEETIEEELINQTYINAQICTNKFSNVQQSIKFLLVSFLFFISLLIVLG